MKKTKLFLCIAIIFISAIISLVVYTGRKIVSTHSTLSIGLSENVEDAKKRGVFLWEYKPDTLFVLDSIPVIVTSCFAQNACQWEDYDSDSIIIKSNSFVICRFDSCTTIEDNHIYTLRDLEYLEIDCEHRYDEGLPPDSLPVYVIERKHHNDENGNVVIDTNPQGYYSLGDTIQTFYLHKKVKM